jgi:hypothetical protein
MTTGVIAHLTEHVAGTQSLNLYGEQPRQISSTMVSVKIEKKVLAFYKDWKTISPESILRAPNFFEMPSAG